jgi:hypothetical protein
MISKTAALVLVSGVLLIALVFSGCGDIGAKDPGSPSSTETSVAAVDAGDADGADGQDTAETIDVAARDAFLEEFFTEDEDWGDEGWGDEGWGDEEDEEIILLTYQVNGDEISDPAEASVSGDLVELQRDTEAQEEIWDYFINFMPAEQREPIAEFIIFTDGAGNVLAATDQLDETQDTWSLEIDLADTDNKAELTYTLLHEYAHILTLNNAQFVADASSGSTYQSEDNYTAEDSYLNLFYQQFWADIYSEWEGYYDDDDVDAFYELYPDQFLTDYAATEPEEDIAESWLYFIISLGPEGSSIAEQKIEFFYDFPEMVSLREEIRNNLYTYLMEQ